MSYPDGAYVVTLKDVWQKLENVGDTLNALNVTITEIKPIVQTAADHESRIRALERFKWVMLGGAALLGAVAGYSSALVTIILHK